MTKLAIYIYYGRRYYSPSLGRWLTPDPKGFIDGLNLYAFVSNNPLVNLDLYGLEKNPLMPIYDDNLSFRKNMKNIDHSMTQGVMKFGADIFMGVARQLGYSEKFQMQTRTLEMIKNKHFSYHYAQFIDYTAHKIAPFDCSSPYLSKLSRHTTNSCHIASIACGGKYVVEKVLNRLGRTQPSQANAIQYIESSFDNQALSGLKLSSLDVKIKKTFSSIFYNRNPLKGTQYTRKVLNDMRLNSKTANPDFHSFPKIVDNYAKHGKVEKIIGRDGIKRTKVSIKGSYLEKNGSFEWIIEPDKSINHRFFKIQE